MNSHKKYLFIFLLIIPLFISLAQASIENVSECKTLDGSGGVNEYILNKSIIDPEDTCFPITADNIILNGNGFLLDGDGIGTDYAIYADGIKNLTVMNFANITNFTVAVFLSGSNNSIINNITASYNKQTGIYLFSSENNNISNINLRNNPTGLYLYSSNSNNLSLINLSEGTIGFSMYFSSNNLVRNLNMTNNRANFYPYGLSNSDFNNNIDTSNIIDGSYKLYYNYSISNITFSSNDTGMVVCSNCFNITIADMNLSHYNMAGVLIFNTTNSLLKNITSSSNYYSGIYSAFSKAINISDINTNDNINHGVYIYSGSNHLIHSSTANNNTYHGFYLSASSNNTLYNITSMFNKDVGLYLYYGSNNLVNFLLSSNNSYGSVLSSSSKNKLINIESYNNVNSDISSDDSWTTSTQTILSYNNTFGEILFQTLSSDIIGTLRFGDGYNINIKNNSAYVNLNSDISELNISANITLRGLNSFNNPVIYRDGTNQCNATTSPSCYNFTSLSAGTVIFNVSSWSNYSIVDLNPTGADTTNPSITIISPVSQVYDFQTILFNISATDDVAISSCWYSLDSGANNKSMSNSGIYWNATNYSMNEDSYTFIAYCNDTSNNLDSETRQFSIRLVRVISSGGGGSAGGTTVVTTGNVTYNNSIAKIEKLEPPEPALLNDIIQYIIDTLNWISYKISPENQRLGLIFVISIIAILILYKPLKIVFRRKHG